MAKRKEHIIHRYATNIFLALSGSLRSNILQSDCRRVMTISIHMRMTYIYICMCVYVNLTPSILSPTGEYNI